MSYNKLAADLMADARSYLSTNFGGVDMSSLPADSVRATIDKIYEGGWSAYEADFRRVFAPAPRVSTEISPIKRKAMVQHFINKRLQIHDEIMSADFTDTVVKIVVSFADVDYRARRDVIKSRRTVLYVFTRTSTDEPWTRNEVDYEEDVKLEHVRWGTVNTPQRAAEQREQFETCYRPGTEKVPMQGWVARLEVSHEQAHANETFQRNGAKS